MKTQKFVSYQKLSKKARKEIDRKKRSGWGTLSPATQIEEPHKLYRRNPKHRKREEDFYA
ncbi:MAG: hypothetical protein IJ642_02420 [Oscillospiraceae bacterium]|nr:hypothetical protein [Oscillospiraceae bacterium]